MYREIIVPTQSEYTIHLPEEYIGKRIQLTAEYDDLQNVVTPLNAADSQILDFYNSMRINMSDFVFDRNEVNTHD